jgi:glycosyltransferase involved in cell wall biosynthesis
MNSFTKLSILVPIYNEEKSIDLILKSIKEVVLINNIIKEIILINDCSTDSSEFKIQEFQKNNPDLNIQYLAHQKNKGKGAAIHTGIAYSSGEYLIIQDADLEYDPEEFNILIKAAIKCDADAIYGSRFIGGKQHRVLFFWHTIGNKFLTILSNLFTDLNLTDMETCYKLIKTKLIKNIPLKENRFGFEPEITAKISKIPNLKLYEVGISYYGRTYEEGKKIGWKDGFRAIYCIIKYNTWAKYRFKI